MIAGSKRYRKFPIFDVWGGLLNTMSRQLPPLVLSAFFSPIIVGRMLPVRYLNYLEEQLKGFVRRVMNKKKDVHNTIQDKNKVEDIKYINQKRVRFSIKTKIQELKSKKWTYFALKFWSLFWIGLMLGVFIYFTSLIFIDYIIKNPFSNWVKAPKPFCITSASNSSFFN